MQRTFFATLAFLVISFSVSAQDQFISIGSGGGFAGTTTHFKITPKGEVFRGEGIGDAKFTECGKIRKKKAKQLLTQVSDKMQATISFHYPGNIFYFISYTENNNKRTITWGDANHPVHGDVKKLYEEVLATISSINYKPIK